MYIKIGLLINCVFDSLDMNTTLAASNTSSGYEDQNYFGFTS